MLEWVPNHWLEAAGGLIRLLCLLQCSKGDEQEVKREKMKQATFGELKKKKNNNNNKGVANKKTKVSETNVLRQEDWSGAPETWRLAPA